jgi:hypothetical protein
LVACADDVEMTKPLYATVGIPDLACNGGAAEDETRHGAAPAELGEPGVRPAVRGQVRFAERDVIASAWMAVRPDQVQRAPLAVHRGSGDSRCSDLPVTTLITRTEVFVGDRHDVSNE